MECKCICICGHHQNRHRDVGGMDLRDGGWGLGACTLCRCECFECQCGKK